MKIAFVYDVVYPYIAGGVQKRIWELAKRLVPKGHQLHIFGMKYWRGSHVYSREGIRFHGVCPPQDLYDGERRSIAEAIRYAWKVALPLASERFDIIDCQNFPYFPCFPARLATGLRRTTLVISWHEVWNNYWYEYLGRRGIFGRTVERAVSHLTRNIVAVSDATKKDLESIGIRGDDVTVIPNGIDFEAIRGVPPDIERSDVIFVGRLIREKNVDLLLRAISLTKTELPGVRCTIIGDGPEFVELRKLSQGLGLSENITFKGFLKEYDGVLAHMKSSKVFVSPTKREGFGIVALEANACGLPVITASYNRNAMSSLVTDGVNGYLCQPTAEDIARKIVTSIDRGGTLSSSCIESARGFDWDRMASLAETYYSSLLGK